MLRGTGIPFLAAFHVSARAAHAARSARSARSRTDVAWLAQACAVARCAGTLVNLRKPLCNLGSVLASEIHGARVVLQSCWILVADSVGAVVEVRARARALSC